MMPTKPMTTHYAEIAAYPTKDGSEIRELMHPDQHGNTQQSLAEARVETGQTTQLHRHLRSEELYHITGGQGHMTLGDNVFDVKAGDTVCIPPGTPHCITNTGTDVLTLLCCCAPAYQHTDTELIDTSP